MKKKEERGRGRDREANLFPGETSWRIAEITEPGVADLPARIGAHGGLDREIHRERQGLWEGDERDEGGKERAVPIYSTFARADS